MLITKIDLQKIDEELKFRVEVELPRIKKLIVDAKAHGDTSDNADYREARRERNNNAARIEHLQKIKFESKVVEAETTNDKVGFGSRVELFFVSSDDSDVYILTSTLRQDAANGYISNVSPLGKAIFGKRVGSRVEVAVSESIKYEVEIKKIECGFDADIGICKF